MLDALRLGYDRVVYIGDGGGDFCPCTRLLASDVAFARRRYPKSDKVAPLLAKIQKSGRFIIEQQNRLPQGPSYTQNGRVHDVDRRPFVFVWNDPTELAFLLETFVDTSI